MKMTKEKFIEKYGDILVTFTDYYKYTFTFKGTTRDGKTIVVDVGTDSDSIYRFEVAAGVPKTIRDLDPYSGQVVESTDPYRMGDSFYEY